MKKDEIPQDPGALGNQGTDLYFVVDESGNYTTGKSCGWQVKNTALELAWTHIEHRIHEAKKEVLENKASPLLFFIELNLMDAGIVSAYTGFWKWQVRRHLKPSVFLKTPEKILKKYAELFGVSIEELKNPRWNAYKF